MQSRTKRTDLSQPRHKTIGNDFGLPPAHGGRHIHHNYGLGDSCNGWSLFIAVIGDFKRDHNRRHRHSALGYLTPAEYAGVCRHSRL
jgi:transposase InsO family protein